MPGKGGTMAIGTVGPVVAEAPLATGHPGRPPSQRPGDGSAGSGSAGLPPAAGALSPDPVERAAATPLDRVVAAALARQDGLAPLFAAAAALVARGGALPAPAQDAIARLLGLALADPPDGAALRALVARSGLFHEAMMMAGDPRARTDLKAVLAEVRGALADFLARHPAGPMTDAVRERRPPPRPGTLPPAEPAMPLPEEVDAAGLARRLVEETDRGLARLALFQASVLEEAGPRAEAGKSAAFAATVPIAGPAGISLATIRVERDDGSDGGTPEAPSEPTWRVDLSLAMEPLGPIEARIGLLAGRRVVAGLWCEDPAAVQPLLAGIDVLRRELEAAGIDLGALDVHIGKPPPKPRTGAPAAHRIDIAL
jgi:hypothetical protein